MSILKRVAAPLFEPLCHPEYWFRYRRLSPEDREWADATFQLLKSDPRHPSLRFKKIGIFWSVRIGLRHRALARERKEGFVWFWIGKHDVYEQILKR
jgi:hypothetical protein